MSVKGPDESPSVELGLAQWDLYDILLNDVPLWDGDVVVGGPPAAQPGEGTAPGQGESTPERRLHGLPARHLPPLPRLPLQTLDALETTEDVR